MLAPPLAALQRSAQDLPAAAATGNAPVRRATAREAVLPELGEGQLEPMPGTISFGELLSALNPLQHLPLVGTIYRAITGETLAAPLRVAGGFLLGGPIGAVASAVGAAAEDIFDRTRAEARGAPAQSPANTPATPQLAQTNAAAGAAAGAADAAPGGIARAATEPAAPAASGFRTAPPAIDGEERLRRLRLATEAYARQATPPVLAMPAQPVAARLAPGLPADPRG